MIRRTRRLLSVAGFLFLGAACATPQPHTGPGTVTWRGEVRVTEDVTVPRGSRLVLEPGTVVRFAYRDDDGDGWGDAEVRIEGDLVAVGTAAAPIVFTSEAEPVEPGQWGAVRADFGTVDVAYAVVEGSSRGLHVHFSKGRISDSVFRHNVDGTRFGQSTLAVERCLFTGNVGKGLNQRRCRNSVVGNVFRRNRNGIFLFETDEGSAFERNVFRENDHPFRLGDFFTGAVRTRGNDWGGAPPSGEDAGAGRPEARLETTPGEVSEAGPRGWPRWDPARDERPGETE
ncbi:MAG: NosD domain-containing protein [Thermodesulfobacteriota bacterium]